MDHLTLMKVFGAFFAIMNPFVNLPLFLALTSGFSAAQQRSLAIRVVALSAVVSLVILVAGHQIITFFGIGVDQFRIAGGLVLSHIAWNMLNGEESPSHHGSPSEKAEMPDLSALAFYPITFPMIVGPGTIATLIIYAGHAKGLPDLMQIGGALAAVLATLLAVLWFSPLFSRVLSTTLRVIISRLMGMILLAIGVEMIFAGIKAVLPGLA
ncbi:MAG: antibiotic resistance protein MarC [Rhodobacterales bacterium]|nr:MAG: antibiotic resistance protein MarC [Rhodobacterales bacterium]